MAAERADQATILPSEETTEPQTENPEATATETNPEAQYEFHICYRSLPVRTDY